MADELKPCPACGGENVWPETNYGPKAARCDACDLLMYDWNTRPIEAALLARAEAAEEKLDKVRKWRDDNLDYVCSCSEAYTSRNLIDGDCQWHDIETSDLDAILAPGGGEKGKHE